MALVVGIHGRRLVPSDLGVGRGDPGLVRQSSRGVHRPLGERGRWHASSLAVSLPGKKFALLLFVIGALAAVVVLYMAIQGEFAQVPARVLDSLPEGGIRHSSGFPCCTRVLRSANVVATGIGCLGLPPCLRLRCSCSAVTRWSTRRTGFSFSPTTATRRLQAATRTRRKVHCWSIGRMARRSSTATCAPPFRCR